MRPPDATTAALPVGARARPWWPIGLGWFGVVLLAAAVTAGLTTMVSVQAGLTAALLVLAVGLYLWSRTAGLVVVWLTWLVAPFVRRVLVVSDPLEAADPLALAPFLLTAAVIALELPKAGLSRRAWQLLLLVGAGYAIGIPLGLIASPPAAAFALFAYATAAGVLVIGYREGGEGGRLVLPTALMVMTPLLALYAFPQYYLPLAEWDQVWFDTAEIETTGSGDGDRVRVWSTLNSPGTFGLVAAAAVVCFVALSRLRPLQVTAALAVLGALTLSYVRSAWLGAVVGVIVVLVASRGAALKRVAPIGLIMVALAPLAFGGSTGGELGDRAETIGALGQDESALSRIETSVALFPQALSLPLGRGIGQAGEATTLSDTGGFRNTDNGYLSLMFQVGPVGFLLVMAGAVIALRASWRNVRGGAGRTDVLVAGMLAFFVVTLFAGDHLYGIGGMIFWYTCGLALRRSEPTT